MKKLSFFIAMLLLFSGAMFAQVSINADNSPPNSSAMLDVKSTTSGILIPRMTSAQRSAIISPANGLMVYQTDGIAGFYYYDGVAWTALAGGAGVPSHYVGELFGGGIIFWLDQTGQHGLIVSLVDISTSIWSAVYTTTGAVSTWNGQGNSTIILGISPAAQFCDSYVNSINYNTGTYSDWYLPAIDELSLIYHARYILNKNIESAPAPTNLLSTLAHYWSSTETNNNYSYYYNFYSGYADATSKGVNNWVRAVRAF